MNSEHEPQVLGYSMTMYDPIYIIIYLFIQCLSRETLMTQQAFLFCAKPPHRLGAGAVLAPR